MQKTYNLVWNLIEVQEEKIVQRHCSNCGKTVNFHDTTIRRHNANGKNIYRYAIFKCKKNHTWNQKLETYKSYTGHVRKKEELQTHTSEKETLCIKSLSTIGIEKIKVSIDQVSGSFRLDKVISEKVDGWSRSEVVRMIKDGSIRLNGSIVKPGFKVASQSTILIDICHTKNRGSS